jgi:phosphatidylglycerol:prolipoprotein diacylglycerol transferase
MRESMRPIVFHLAGHSIHGNHVTLLLGGLLALLVIWMEMRRMEEAPGKIWPLLILLILSGLIGARLLYCIDFRGQYMCSLSNFFAFWKGGTALYGGVIFAFIIYCLYITWQRLDFWRIGDMLAPGTTVFVFVARIGCILVGCCYGKPCSPDHPLAITFNNYSSPAPKFVPLYPTQPLFAATTLLVFVVLWMRRKRKRFEGEIALIGVSLYTLFSFFIEFLRGDPRVLYEIAGISLSQNQIIGALIFLVASGCWVAGYYEEEG